MKFKVGDKVMWSQSALAATVTDGSRVFPRAKRSDVGEVILAKRYKDAYDLFTVRWGNGVVEELNGDWLVAA